MKLTWSGALLGRTRRRLAGGSARRGVMAVVAAGVAVVCAGLLTGAGLAPAAAGARAAAAGVQWGRAEKVPGLATLNRGGNAHATSVSCWAVNYCAAGGYYTDRRGHSQAFVVTERKGRWGDAVQVPGTAALNTGGTAGVSSVSCTPRGYCAAGGNYTDRRGHNQAFVVTWPKHHRWRAAVEVPGSAALNTAGSAQVTSVSCVSAGNCAAGGYYDARACRRYAPCDTQAFVVSQAGGVWGTAEELPGTAALNTAGSARVTSVSCWSAGNCAASGYYNNGPGGPGAFVASEEKGVWDSAQEVPGLAALNTAGAASATAVSCARDGYCAAGGVFTQTDVDGNDNPEPFVVSANNGVWGTAVAWPLDFYGLGLPETLDAVSCASADYCGAAGYTSFTNYPGTSSAFWVSQTNGVWAASDQSLPGYYAQNLTSLSCPSTGNCGAGGYCLYCRKGSQAVVAGERNGVWANAKLMPGALALDKSRNAQVTSVSCPSAGNCTAAGFYTDAKKRSQAFVSGP